MNIRQSFNSDKTRALFGQRLGEIIEGVIGDTRVRQLLDDAGKHPDEYAGKPTGRAALDLGVIPPATKNALLAAQAAVRALDAADRAELALQGQPTPPSRALDDDVFKYVGSDQDPDFLKRAQATWMIAEHYHGETAGAPGSLAYADAYRHRQMYEDNDHSAAGVESLRAAARDSLKEAAAVLLQENHLSAGNDIGALAQSIAVKPQQIMPGGPGFILRASLNHAYDEARRAAEVSASGQFWEVPQDTEQLFGRLAALAAPAPKPGPASAAALKQHGP